MMRRKRRRKRQAASPRQARDRLWFAVHSWLGLKLSLLMTFILATGTIAVFSHEIDWLLVPEMRASERIAAESVAWGAAYDAMRREYPEYRARNLSRFEDNWFSLHMIALTPWRETVRLWFDPPDGRLLGATPFYNVQRFFRAVHRHLMMPTNLGVPIVASLAFPLLVSLVAGIVVYKKFWRGLFRWPRFKRNARIWNGDVHRLMGLWGSWFIALIALTSVWYFVESLGGRSPPFPRPELDVAQRQAALPDSFTGARLELALALARQELPGLRVRRVLFPRNSGAPLIVQGDLEAKLVRPRANGVYIDPATLTVLGSYRGEQLGLHSRISEAADPLHFGDFGGFATKLLWLLFGIMMTAMSITGIAIYAGRLRSARQAAIAGEPVAIRDVREAETQ